MKSQLKHIKVFEHEKLTLHEDKWERFLTPKQLQKLLEFNDKGGNKYFTPIRDGVKFNQYVGVVSFGTLTIEILPKADKIGVENEENTKVWRNVLLKMLAISGNINLESVSEANLRKRNNSLLDLYFEKYVKEVESLLRKGLIKKYNNKQGNLKTLKGRLDFANNIRNNLVHKERFFTNYIDYNFEHLLNQILLKALRILTIISRNNFLVDKINKLIFNFPEIKEIEINKSSFDKIVLDRKSEKYSEALKIAKMVILNYSPDLSKGQDTMLALLFNMNDLWEKYIYTMLKRSEEKNGYYVKYHQRKDFWKTRRVEPDIILKKGNETLVIDTKWKLISENNPSIEDLKQMFVYNMYWGACKSMLLYPKDGEKKDGDYGHFKNFHLNENMCKIAFVSVLDNNNKDLNFNIGEEIFEKLL